MEQNRSRQIGDLCRNSSRQIIFLLAMATKTVAAWSAAYKCDLLKTIYPNFSITARFWGTPHLPLP